MRILIIEDDSRSRELLKYLLEDRFKSEAKFREASNLEAAFGYLKHDNVDCVILDLNLPDSSGKETFIKVRKAYPTIPVVVMTNNKNREMAVDMVKEGASDYILKDFTNEEEIFRRILFAIERGKHSITVPPEDAKSIHKMQNAQAKMLTAHESGQHNIANLHSVETIAASADTTRHMFAGMQSISLKVERFSAQLDHIDGTVNELKDEIRGGPNRRSIRAEMDLSNLKIKKFEEYIKKTEEAREEEERVSRVEAVQIHTTKISNRTKIIVAFFSLLGIILAATIGGYVSLRVEELKSKQEEKHELQTPN
jgi:DNA-binding response OmpR family regulator